MSTTNSVSNSSGSSYAQQLAESSALKRSLYSLGQAVQTGDLDSAGSILNALVKAHPEYAASGSGASDSTDPINAGFQALTTAISKKDAQGARSAWNNLKGALAKEGLNDLGSGTTLAANTTAQLEASMDQNLVSALLGGSSSNSASNVSTLLGLDSGSQSSVNSSVSNWLLYKADSTTTTSTPDTSTSGTNLDTQA